MGQKEVEWEWSTADSLAPQEKLDPLLKDPLRSMLRDLDMMVQVVRKQPNEYEKWSQVDRVMYRVLRSYKHD